MKVVFVGGSRKIARLNKEIKQRLDNIIDQNFGLVVGDANGADKAVQKYCYDKQYTNVTVFCAGGHCRNNLGSWKVHNVLVDSNKKGFDFFVAKDIEMAKEADYGFMLWDAKSNGTLNNILQLLQLEKCALVYYSPENNFIKIKTVDDLEDLLSKCDKTQIEQFELKLQLSKKLKSLSSPEQLPLLPSCEAMSSKRAVHHHKQGKALSY